MRFISIGELLIDFTPAGKTADGIHLFARNPGGAPANVAVQMNRLGIEAGFIGTVGNDMFGAYLKEVLEAEKINTQGLAFDEDYSTSLAFVELDENGNREFSFYRDPGADTRLIASADNKRLIDSAEMICFGSLMMTAEPSRSAVKELAAYAKGNGVITVYDPNWRPALWKNRAEGVEMMKALVEHADVMKLSDEELALITGESELKAGAEKLISQGVKLVVITLGAKGCAVFTEDFSFAKHTYDTKVVDTTGSGDSFLGAFLNCILASGKRLEEIGQAEAEEYADFANAAGSLCAAKKGAIPALPAREEIDRMKASTPLLIM